MNQKEFMNKLPYIPLGVNGYDFYAVIYNRRTNSAQYAKIKDGLFSSIEYVDINDPAVIIYPFIDIRESRTSRYVGKIECTKKGKINFTYRMEFDFDDSSSYFKAAVERLFDNMQLLFGCERLHAIKATLHKDEECMYCNYTN